jgi:hypothetical protein
MRAEMDLSFDIDMFGLIILFVIASQLPPLTRVDCGHLDRIPRA